MARALTSALAQRTRSPLRRYSGLLPPPALATRPYNSRRPCWPSLRHALLDLLPGSTGLEPAASGVTVINSRPQHLSGRRLTAGATLGCHAATRRRGLTLTP